MRKLASTWKRAGTRVGFVPTMGCLHAGHMSLVRRARSIVGARGVVVVSLYVNPTQFAPHEDLAKYPRTLARDKHLCRAAGVDVLFAPTDAQMYPGRVAGDFSTHVIEEKLSMTMEGAARPTHFRGVATVVAKLFNLVLPDVAVFGAKDFQQAAVVQRMVRDLNFPVKIVVAPTHREPDGLAMSSRNQYLDANERAQATVLWHMLRLARTTVRVRPTPAAWIKAQIAKLISLRPAARLDYIEFFDPGTLRPVAQARRGTQLALAVFIGRTRLIDNAKL